MFPHENVSWTGFRSGHSAMSTTLGRSPVGTDDFVVALIENRAWEVGVAVFNLGTFQLSIGQLSDTIGFSKTLSLLNGRFPSNFIFSHTSINESPLFQVVSRLFEAAALTCVNRRVFNDVIGARRLMELTSSTHAIGFIADSANYLALGAAAALIQFVEESLLCTLVPNTIRVSVIELDHYVTIDRASAIALQIIPSSRLAQQPTLMSACNNTVTPGGSRLLSTNIIQPIREVQTLRLRQEAVVELVKNQNLYRIIRQLLRRCSHFDVDKLISVFSRQRTGAQRIDDARHVIESTIALRSVLEVTREMESAMSELVSGEPGGSQLLLTSQSALSECKPTEFIDYIDLHLDSSIANSADGRKPQGALLQVQHCFALKSEDPFSLLELKRKAFSECIEEIFSLGEALRTEFSISALRIVYRPPRGYVLLLPIAEARKLPEGEYFGRVVQSKSVTCVSHTLLRLNDKLTSSVGDILSASESALSSMLPYFWSHIGHLHAISETLALLDVLQSHAFLALQFGNSVCTPGFSDDNVTCVRDALPLIAPAGKQPNTIELRPSQPFLAITGPNASGKTTILITFAHMLVLAFLGCLIPAREAIISPVDRIIAIMPSCDIADVGTSSFVKEMRHLAYLSHTVSKHSLLLVDELGRGTSSAEGSAVSCATAEWLVDVGCHSIFTTHSIHLARLAQKSDHMRVMHMRVTASESSMRYHFQLTDGASEVDNYGLRLLAAIQSEASELVLERALSFLSDE